MARIRLTLARRIAALEQRQAPNTTYAHLSGVCGTCGKLRYFSWFKSLPPEWFETDVGTDENRAIYAPHRTTGCECPANRLSLALLQSIAAAPDADATNP